MIKKLLSKTSNTCDAHFPRHTQGTNLTYRMVVKGSKVTFSSCILQLRGMFFGICQQWQEPNKSFFCCHFGH
uniref:Uncharacterized protein n=1 Tax=Anguilla anguilla TaxID=7936 RepID=A0A0E9WSN3_ANGAN